MPTTAELRFFGAFEAIRSLDLPNTTLTDLYEGFYAGFYDELTKNDDFDVPVYLRIAKDVGGPVLDLACGSGRIALPLAAAGHETVGLEYSRDMLKVLRQQLHQQADPQARARFTPVRGDMTAFSLDRRFRMIIIGAMSICLLRERQQRLDAFRSIAGHLEPGGVFAFDYLDTNPAALAEQDDRISAVSQATGDLKRFTLLGRRHYPAEQVQLVNFYSEVSDAQDRTRRYLGSTAKWVVDIAAVEEELAAADLRIVDRLTLQEVGDSHPETVRLLLCQHT